MLTVLGNRIATLRGIMLVAALTYLTVSLSARCAAQEGDPAAEPPAGQSQATAAPPAVEPTPADDLGELPWRTERPQPPAARLPGTRVSGPREMLVLLGIAESQIDSFFDGVALNSDNDETLTRILFRLPQFPLEDIQSWQHTEFAWSQLVANPAAFRGQFFGLEGRVTHVEKHPLIPEIAALYSFDHYYLVSFQPRAAPNPVVLCTRRFPKAWPVGHVMDQRASASGLFLKVGSVEGEHPQLVFAAPRIAWHPDRVDPALGVNAGQALLGELRMDVGLFDNVRSRNRKGISALDRECFYQLLAASRRLKPPQIAAAREAAFDLGAALNEPERQHGRLFTLVATARRITRIAVNDPDIQQRFQIDHYFQIDAFLPLGNTTVRLGRSKDDPQGPVFTNHYPATFCTLSLPEELQQLSEDFQQGKTEAETLREQIQVTGFFFKLWAYKSDYVSSFDRRQSQLSPMLVVIQPRLLDRGPARNPLLSLFTGLAFLILLAAVWLGMWRYSRRDAEFEQTTLKRQFEVRPEKSLDDLDVEVRDEPDFRGLDQ